MAKILHSMIRVRDENKSVNFYRKAFGLEVAQRFPFDGFTLVYLRNPENDFELELTINHGRASRIPTEMGTATLPLPSMISRKNTPASKRWDSTQNQ